MTDTPSPQVSPFGMKVSWIARLSGEEKMTEESGKTISVVLEGLAYAMRFPGDWIKIVDCDEATEESTDHLDAMTRWVIGRLDLQNIEVRRSAIDQDPGPAVFVMSKYKRDQWKPEKYSDWGASTSRRR